VASDMQGVAVTIEQHFETAWAALTEVDYGGGDFEPPDASWVRHTIRWGDAFEDSQGPNARITGVVILQLFGKPGGGYGPLTQLGDAARDVFNLVDMDGGIEFRPASGPVEVKSDDEAWLQVNVSAAFEVTESVA